MERMRKTQTITSTFGDVVLYSASQTSQWRNNRIGPIVNNMVVDITNHGGLLSVIAETNSSITKVVFEYDKYVRTETGKPFSMDGDNLGYLVPVYYLGSAGTKNMTTKFFAGTTLVGTIKNVFTVTRTPLPLPLYQSNAPFVEKNGIIVMEAESIPIDTPWSYEQALLGYTGSGYYRFDGNSYSTGGAKGRLSYLMNITTTGTYQLLLRSNKNHPDTTWSNDCYVKLKNQTTGLLANLTKTFQSDGRYKWSSKTRASIGHTTYRSLYSMPKVGLYELQISGRSKNFHLDRIVLFKTSLYNETTIMNQSATIPESFRVGQVVPTVAPTGVPSFKPSSVPSI